MYMQSCSLVLLFCSHYNIQEEGFVQEIHYVSDTEMGSLRLVYSADEEPSRFVTGMQHDV